MLQLDAPIVTGFLRWAGFPKGTTVVEGYALDVILKSNLVHWDHVEIGRVRVVGKDEV